MYPGLVLYPELILVSQGINSFLRVWFLYPRIVFFIQGCFLYLRVCSCIPGLVFVAQKGFCFFLHSLYSPSSSFLLIFSFFCFLFFKLLLNYRKVPFFQHYSLDWLKLKFESNSFLFIPKFNGFHYTILSSQMHVYISQNSFNILSDHQSKNYSLIKINLFTLLPILSLNTIHANILRFIS